MDLPNKIDKEPIQHQIDYVKFDFYAPSSVKNISIKSLTDPIAFDSFNNPTKGGLHDPLMGVGAYDKIGYCQSCGQNSHDCTGHMGHIELSAILYNPFMLNYILKLMRNKCFFCHKLRISDKDKIYIFMKILLIKLGFAKEATEFKGIIFSTANESTAVVEKKVGNFLNNFSHNNLVKESNSDDEDTEQELIDRERQPSIDTSNTDDTNNTHNDKKKKKKRKTDEEDLHEINRKENIEKFKLFSKNFKNRKIDELLNKIEKLDLTIKRTEDLKNIFDQSLNNNIILKDAINEFWKLVKSGKCPHCEALNSRIKKVGNIKFFQTPFTKKILKKMKKTGINPHKDALEDGSALREEMKINKKKKSKLLKEKKEDSEDSDNDAILQVNENGSESESESEVDVQNEDSHKYLHPMEIKEHIKKLWELDGDILSIVFGNVLRKEEIAKNNSSGIIVEEEDEDESSEIEKEEEKPESNIVSKNKYNFQISSTGSDMFFIESLIVPPNRFRPENKGGLDGAAYLHGQTVALSKLLTLSNDLRNLSLRQKEMEEQKENNITIKQITMKDIITKWTEMQDTVNILFDSTKAANKKDGDKAKGIKQILEKKEGIYRTKMMGKRVNYAGRSVISPDPMIGSNEVGIPLYIAQKLTFAETVTKYNKEKLQKLVINGNKKYPGASMIQNEDGRTTSLDFVKDEYRLKLSENLKQGQIVYRHMHTGDALLVNRQPTLHKPSIMSHKARVLRGEKTIRLHYANCNTYNADFDGDEMNIHFLQNHIARQEAYTISNTDNQYIVPTSGKPIRGLIQDSIVSAVFITMKNSFFTREEFNQMVYSCLEAPLNNGTIRKIVVPIPAIMKPKILFTGKQIISSILKSLITSKMVDHILNEESEGINFDHPTKLAKEVWGPDHELEGTVVIRDNELLTGVLDKNHIGNSEFGLVHSFYEIYGPEMAGELISTIGRLFINYLQFYHGFTCGVDDIILKEESNLKRRMDIENIIIAGMTGLANYLEMDNFNLNLNNYSRRNVFTRKTAESIRNLKLIPEERKNIEKLLDLQNVKLENIYNNDDENIDNEQRQNSFNLIRELKEKYYEIVLKDDTKTIDANVDTVVKNAINGPTSDCSKNWLKGLVKTFPKNYFSMMVLSGAKGSLVNHSQITCMLGQQELEGRRVPRMASGRTLPSFEPFDPNPRAGGYVSDRFSTGIRPQEFFFHCMAGREGLIDTAVKTSRSGYLQRCLIKHLEQLVVGYDYTVRDTDGNVIQFLYGEDSIDVMNTRYLTNFKFLANNIKTYYDKYRPERLIEKIDMKTIRKIRKNFDSAKDTIMNKYSPWSYLGSVSDRIFLNMTKYIEEDKDNFFKNDDDENYNHTTTSKRRNSMHVAKMNFNKQISKTTFKNAVYIKYLNSLIQPGESVGILAGQSVGEPSTQMTLNTFHLAGHGGVNMTLGIPRLREILMTSEKNIKTPIMVLPMFSKDLETIKKLARNFEKYHLIDIIKEISINQKIVIVDKNTKFRTYLINIKTEDFSDIESYFNHGYENLIDKFKAEFVTKFAKYISKQIKISGKKGQIVSGQVRTKNKDNKNDENNTDDEKEENFESKKKIRDEEESDDDNDEQEYEDVDNSKNKKKNREDTEETYTDEEDRTENDETTTNNDAHTDDETIRREDTLLDDQDDELSESSLDEEQVVVEINGKKIEKISHKRGEKLKKEIDFLNRKNYDHENVKIREMHIDRETSSFYFELAIPFNHKNLLVKNMLDHTLKSITFKSVKNINRCHIIDRKVNNELEYTLQLEGINFDEVIKFMNHIDVNRIQTNDIGSLKEKYGIEACRASVVKEINMVFDAYHISVDKRHLGLIADYMTHQGNYRSFNRKGLSTASSPFLKMTFESTMEYMIQSCISKEIDHGKSASSSIILGQVPKCGTGMFSVMQTLVGDKNKNKQSFIK